MDIMTSHILSQEDMSDRPWVGTKVENISRLTHEVNKIYCEGLGESMVPWTKLSDELKYCTADSVQFLLDNPTAGAKECHENWVTKKLGEGWKYGKEKDEGGKVHPYLVDYEKLSPQHQSKDQIFVTIVRHCVKLLEECGRH